MGDAGFFKGTSSDQDSRFSNKEKKLLKSMSFPPEFDAKVDMKKVNLDVIKPWISNRITQLLGFEDEVVIDFAIGLLEEENPDPKTMQINLTGFLEKSTQPFILELWKLLISAQTSLGGIPKMFLEQKKEELRQKKDHEAQLKIRQTAVMDAIRRRKESDMEDIRGNEQKERERRSRF
ncbi:PWI domain-containing protein, partial [Phycomyces blakesleeanus]